MTPEEAIKQIESKYMFETTGNNLLASDEWQTLKTAVLKNSETPNSDYAAALRIWEDYFNNEITGPGHFGVYLVKRLKHGEHLQIKGKD